MNAKKCKVIRNVIRRAGLHPRETRYMIQPGSSKFYYSGTRVLVPQCGRAAYQKIKRGGFNE